MKVNIIKCVLGHIAHNTSIPISHKIDLTLVITTCTLLSLKSGRPCPLRENENRNHFLKRRHFQCIELCSRTHNLQLHIHFMTEFDSNDQVYALPRDINKVIPTLACLKLLFLCLASIIPSVNPCVSSCSGKPDGDYQSCRNCNEYATCLSGKYFVRNCPPAHVILVWDDTVKTCRYTSNTCVSI